MYILCDYTIFEKAFSYTADAKKREIINIFYNLNNKFILNRSLIDLIEKKIPETDAFQAFIKEKFDTNKILNEPSTKNDTFDEQLIEIFKASKLDFIIPLTISNSNLDILKPKLVSLNNSKKKNKDWLVLELISKSICNVCYSDFNNDNDIIPFFESIFDIPKYIKSVIIFNREQSAKLLGSIKGRHIKMYTFIHKKDLPYKNETLKDLKKELGGKLKMYYTSNNRIIHERKIIIGSLIITIDNSFENITIKEPTWEIIINNNEEKVDKWMKKSSKFKEIR